MATLHRPLRVWTGAVGHAYADGRGFNSKLIPVIIKVKRA